MIQKNVLEIQVVLIYISYRITCKSIGKQIKLIPVCLINTFYPIPYFENSFVLLLIFNDN